MVRRRHITFYLPLLKLSCILLKIEFYKARPTTRGRDPFNQFLSTKILFFFLLFFSRRSTIISDLDFDFERVLKLQQLLYFHPRTQASPKVLYSFTIILSFFSTTLKITLLFNFRMTSK